MTLEQTAHELVRLSHDWATAEQHGDITFLSGVLADDFVGVGPRGFTLTKPEWLARLQSGDLRYTSIEWDDVQARVYGDSAVLVGRQTQSGAYQQHDIQGQFRTTLVFVEQQGKWRLASLHLSPIAGPPSTNT